MYTNAGLIETLKREGHIRSRRVGEAFQAVARHQFLPGQSVEKVYSDCSVITKKAGGFAVSAASQPSVVAIMLEQLQLLRGQRVLEVGAGTGYNAALMATMVGPTGRVTTIDIDEDVAATARRNLHASGFSQVRVVAGDGGLGFLDDAPYDRIILTVGAWDIAPAWVDQLAPAGLLLLPLDLNGTQKAVAFRRTDGHLSSASMSSCSFMLLRGEFAGPNMVASLGHSSGIYVMAEWASQIDSDSLFGWLLERPQHAAIGSTVTQAEVWEDLILWLALRSPRFCTVLADMSGPDMNPIPSLFSWPGVCGTVCLMNHSGLALLAWNPAETSGSTSDRRGLSIQSYGSSEVVLRELRDLMLEWETAGRPPSKTIRIRAYPQDAPFVPKDNEFVINKRWFRLVLGS